MPLSFWKENAMKYYKGKGYLVDTFTEDELKNGVDKECVERAIIETGLNYINTEFVYNNKKKITGVKIYVCNEEDVRT